MTLEDRVDILESEIEIEQLRSMYCWYATRGDVDGVAKLFTEDCFFEGPGQVGSQERTAVRGKPAVMKYFAPSIGRAGNVIPLVVNHIIRVTGDTARGTCAMESPVSAGGGGPVVYYYQDEFARTGGRWLFSSRKIYRYKPEPELPANGLGPDGSRS